MRCWLKLLLSVIFILENTGTSLAIAQNSTSRQHLPHGYLIVQEIAIAGNSLYGAISTAREADTVFKVLKDKVDAVEFDLLAYGNDSLRAARIIAESAHRHGIDLWATTWRLPNIIHTLGVPFPREYQAYTMKPDGSIEPAIWDNLPLLDVLNPKAMDWFLERYKEIYIKPFRGVLQGLMFNEDVLLYLGRWSNDLRPDYWRNPTFSPRVLTLWKDYCRKHNVSFNGKPVERFPVHRPEMVAAGNGRTEYFPGYDVPAQIFEGQRFMDLPRAKGVWYHWQEFLAEQFANNFIERLAYTFNEVNTDNPRWYGALYFASFNRCLPYEKIQNRDFYVADGWKWSAWGMQHGCDIDRIARLPDIDAIVCETFPPIRANIECYIAEYARITRSAGKQFGVMLHNDPDWPLGTWDSEDDRWQLIKKYNSDVIMRYHCDSMRPGDKRYNATQEQMFHEQWQRYRTSK